MRSTWVLLVAAACASWAKPQAVKAPPKKVAKTELPAKPKAPAQAKAAAKDPESICQEAWLRGDLATLRRRCVATSTKEDAGSLYWKSLLATDPVVLRKTLNAVHLKSLDSLDSRLLLLAGRYQFSVGESRELDDLAWLAAKRKLKDARIDTLRRLAKGQ